ncbi:MAG: hypothetical protein ACUVWX_03905 [Kiritimatiellia bacterium]
MRSHARATIVCIVLDCPAVVFLVLLAAVMSVIGLTNGIESAEQFGPAGEAECALPSARRWEARGIVGRRSGEALYEIGGHMHGERWSSKLCFPLDGTVAGFSASHTWRRSDGTADFAVELTALHNVEHPQRSMTDTDKYPSPVIIGYTESKAELEGWGLDFRFVKHIQHSPRVRDLILAVVAGYQWQDLSYNIMGLRGFYREPLPEEQVFLRDDELVLTYRLICNAVYAGVAGRWWVAAPLVLDGEVAVGVAYLADHDHHILREKVCRGTAGGVSMQARLALSYEPVWARTKSRAWFFRAEAECGAVRASGTQEQLMSESFYPLQVNVPEDIQVTQRQFDIGVGCRF